MQRLLEMHIIQFERIKLKEAGLNFILKTVA